MLVNDRELLSISRLKALEEVGQHFSEDVQHFKVMSVEFHLHIKTSEFSQMSVSVGVFSAEDRSDLKHFFKITAESHLLIQLGTLGEASRSFVLGSFHVCHAEDVGTTFRSSSKHFRRVNFDESLLVKEFSVNLADTRLKSENSLVSGHSQVNDSVVESHILLDTSELLFLFLFGSLRFFLLILNLVSGSVSFVTLVHHDSASISDLERQDGDGSTNDEA